MGQFSLEYHLHIFVFPTDGLCNCYKAGDVPQQPTRSFGIWRPEDETQESAVFL